MVKSDVDRYTGTQVTMSLSTCLLASRGAVATLTYLFLRGSAKTRITAAALMEDLDDFVRENVDDLRQVVNCF